MSPPDQTPAEVPAWLAEQGRIRHVREVVGCRGEPTGWPGWLPEPIVARLVASGLSAPWRHQREVADAAYGGRHVVVATGTASGKSLGYLMPILAATAPIAPTSHGRRPTAAGPVDRGELRRRMLGTASRPHTALYLAPTKALAHDQLRAAEALEVPGWRVGALDGDSDAAGREYARSHAGLVFTNPDMLHHRVLPDHPKWAYLLGSLAYVVIDESHRYRGVFGAQVAQVVRRLRRLAAHHGADPAVICASATAPDPVASAATLIGVDPEEVALVDVDASPHAATTHVLAEAGADLPAVAADLLADLVAPGGDRPGRQSVVFLPSRKLCEIVALRAQEKIALRAQEKIELRAQEDIALGVQQTIAPQEQHTIVGRHDDPAATAPAVAAYRGGYLAAERRQLERALNDGSLRGVAATNALELGVDIAGLDAVVIGGFPGTMASYWQQAGRAGRRDRAATVIALAGQDQRDAYLLEHPELIFDAPVERTVLDPDNPYVLGPQLAAAAQELPVTPDDERWFGPTMPAVLDRLVASGALRRRGRGCHWTRAQRATELIDLRAQGGPGVQIVERDTGRVIGAVDGSAADAAVHPGAVYLHRGEAHLVLELDHDLGVAEVRVGSPGWTTQPRSTSDVAIIAEHRSRPFGPGRLHRGEVEVTSQVTGYLRRDERTGAVWDETPLDLPVRRLRTHATWWTIAAEHTDRLGLAPMELAGAAHAAEHTGIGLLSVFVPSDRWDVGGLSTPLHPDTGDLTVFVHDGHPGGAGFTERGYGVADRWWAGTLDRLTSCRCSDGCPACVISPKCGNANQVLDKAAAIRLLELLVG